jgi:2'-5' RNA ligase
MLAAPWSGPLTGLVVDVPEAEAVVAAQRLRLDPSAGLGMPAHVTLLFPFVSPEVLDGSVLDAVQGALAGFAAFDYRFERTAWFGAEVLWLAPADPAPFAALAERLWAAFPDYPPYGGAFEAVTPHLTVGQGDDVALLREAERAVLPYLPVAGRAERVSLSVLSATGGRWQPAATFDLS